MVHSDFWLILFASSSVEPPLCRTPEFMVPLPPLPTNFAMPKQQTFFHLQFSQVFIFQMILLNTCQIYNFKQDLALQSSPSEYVSLHCVNMSSFDSNTMT